MAIIPPARGGGFSGNSPGPDMPREIGGVERHVPSGGLSQSRFAGHRIAMRLRKILGRGDPLPDATTEPRRQLVTPRQLRSPAEIARHLGVSPDNLDGGLREKWSAIVERMNDGERVGEAELQPLLDDAYCLYRHAARHPNSLQDVRAHLESLPRFLQRYCAVAQHGTRTTLMDAARSFTRDTVHPLQLLTAAELARPAGSTYHREAE